MIQQIESHEGFGASSTECVRLCRLEDVPLGLGISFSVNGRPLAVFRTRTGGIFAMENRCSHGGGSLSDGMLAGEKVVCPMHAFKFELRDGQCRHGGTCGVETFEADVRDGWVFVELPEMLPNECSRDSGQPVEIM